MDPLLDNAPCGFASFADDGTLLEVNLTLAELVGHPRVELQGWHIQKILTPGSRVFYHTHIFPLLKMRGVAEEIFLPLQTREGEEVQVLMHAVRRERGGAFASDAVFVRMRQRFRYEEELLEARRVADRANAAKAKFLSMMSHDLRTPLTSISGNAALLAAGVHGELNAEQADAVARIREGCEEQLRMINDILSFAQLESGRVSVRVEPVRVIDAVARAERLIRVRVDEAGLSLTTASCDELAVHADADRLQQVLLNLLTNAIKFTARGGTIAVTCARDGERVLIRVADSGVGIPRDQLERIFDPFVQLEHQPADPTQRGVGLGLAISRDLVRAMHGELHAESTPDVGSVFTIALPAAVPVSR
ncbi:MAG TPA: HAMP domain-containing sensor histidine kinase [Thermoanaerobaculia bacterium]|nr:HAMP domain-containing sensor histidine kinase [Thermoanaerobaculia bacterium]